MGRKKQPQLPAGVTVEKILAARSLMESADLAWREHLYHRAIKLMIFDTMLASGAVESMDHQKAHEFAANAFDWLAHGLGASPDEDEVLLRINGLSMALRCEPQAPWARVRTMAQLTADFLRGRDSTTG